MSNFDIFILLKEYFREIISILGGVGMFFLGKKTRTQAIREKDVTITGNELENVEAALKIYRVMLEDLQIKFTEAQRAYTLLEERFQSALKKNKDYESKVDKLETENNHLTERLKNCGK